MTSGVKEQEATNFLERQFKKKAEYSSEETIQLAILAIQTVGTRLMIGDWPRFQGN